MPRPVWSRSAAPVSRQGDPDGGDGDFTWERFEEKYNADLANNLGNLVNRVASMTERYQHGRIRSVGGGPLAAPPLIVLPPIERR